MVAPTRKNGGPLFARKGGPHPIEFAVKDVISKNQGDAVFANKRVPDEEGLCDSLRSWLLGIFNP
jgi:hypothetical protein